MKMIVFSLFVCLFELYVTGTCATNLPPNTHISSGTFYRNRFFICAPEQQPSLYETQWFGSTLTPVPKLKSYKYYTGVCKYLDVDIRGRLWILDEAGPKIVIYNLVFNTEFHRGELSGVGDHLGQLVVDPVPNPMRAFVSVLDEVLVYSLKEKRYWSLGTGNFGIPFLAVTKREPKLYVCGNGEIWLVGLEQLRKIQPQKDVNVTFLGNTLGPSSGLFADTKGGVYYYLIRDYAIVKWDSRKSLQAENHLILQQNAETLPFVTDFFAGPQFGIWAIVNDLNATEFNFFNRIIKISTIL